MAAFSERYDIVHPKYKHALIIYQAINEWIREFDELEDLYLSTDDWAVLEMYEKVLEVSLSCFVSGPLS